MPKEALIRKKRNLDNLIDKKKNVLKILGSVKLKPRPVSLYP